MPHSFPSEKKRKGSKKEKKGREKERQEEVGLSVPLLSGKELSQAAKRSCEAKKPSGTRAVLFGFFTRDVFFSAETG